MNRHETREIRGRILKILDTNYPFPAGDHLIAEILTDAQYCCSPALVKGHLAYLEEKGYIQVEDVHSEELAISRTMAKLTAHGKDLLEGSIPADPGVTL